MAGQRGKGQQRSWPLDLCAVLAFPGSGLCPRAGSYAMARADSPEGSLGSEGGNAHVLRGMLLPAAPSAAFRGSRALPGGRGSRAEPAGSTAFHPRRLLEGFPASGTQSDYFFPPFFCFLLVVLFILFGGGVGAVSSEWDWGTFLLFPLLCSPALGSRGCSGVGLLCLTC